MKLPMLLTGLFKYREGGLSSGMMLRMLVWSGIVSSLVLLRVGMLFTVSDLEIEARQLQDLALERKQQYDQLRLEVERCQDGDLLLEAANSELRMIALDLTAIERLTLSDALMQKYDLARVRMNDTPKTGADPAREGRSILLSALSFLE